MQLPDLWTLELTMLPGEVTFTCRLCKYLSLFLLLPLAHTLHVHVYLCLDRLHTP